MGSPTLVDSKPVSGLFAQAYRDILANRTRLPTMPDVAVRLRAAMQQANHNVRTVARVVQADTSTTAYLIRIANSPIYRGISPVKDVESGIARLGMKTTRNLVTAHALRAMFQTRSVVLGKLLRSTWRGSARTAAFASILARQLKGFEPDRAMLAGLLQDIGVLPLLGVLERSKRTVTNGDRIEHSLDEFAAKVGVVLLRHWEFDDEMIEVAQTRKDWRRDTQRGIDLADLVMVARWHASVGNDQPHDLPPVDELPAFGKLPLGDVTDDARLGILLKADTEVRELMQLLGV